MIIALRDGYVVVVVFQLDFTVIIEQVIEQFLVVRSAGMISSVLSPQERQENLLFLGQLELELSFGVRVPERLELSQNLNVHLRLRDGRDIAFLQT